MVLFSACSTGQEIDDRQFQSLMQDVADGWSTQNTELALRSFHENVIYMEPPDIQLYRGHEQLRPYFDALEAKHEMEFHNLMFNRDKQIGAGEYTFSYGSDTADTGVVIVKILEGKIAFWREYQRKGSSDFEDFIDTDGKEWQWTIENYP